MEPTRLSWRGRVAIVLIFSAVLSPVVFYPQDRLVFNLVSELGGKVPSIPGWVAIEAANCIAAALLSVVLVAVALGLDELIRRVSRKPTEDMPRCQCGYPLVGLSETRCPECGSKLATMR